MNMYELNKLYGEALSLAINEEGEILDDSLVSLLDEIQEAKETKLLNLVCLIKNLKVYENGFISEIKSLQDRKEKVSKKIESLKKYLRSNLQEGEKLADPRGEINWRKSESVEPTIDIDIFAKENPFYVRTKHELDRALIRMAIKSGEKIHGAKLVEKNNMVIK